MTIKSLQITFFTLISIVVLHCYPLPINAQETTVMTNLVWGKQVGQLQMAAALDKTNGLIHCWVHNATDHEILCPEFDFGYVEYVNLEVQVETNWLAVKPWIFPGGHITLEPLTYHQIAIAPYGVITNRALRYQSCDELMARVFKGFRMDDPRYRGVTNRIILRSDLTSRLCQGDTFAFDFVVYNPFATDIFTNLTHLKARVSQKFRTDKAGNTLVLYSPEFEIPIFKYSKSIIFRTESN